MFVRNNMSSTIINDILDSSQERYRRLIHTNKPYNITGLYDITNETLTANSVLLTTYNSNFGDI